MNPFGKCLQGAKIKQATAATVSALPRPHAKGFYPLTPLAALFRLVVWVCRCQDLASLWHSQQSFAQENNENSNFHNEGPSLPPVCPCACPCPWLVSFEIIICAMAPPPWPSSSSSSSSTYSFCLSPVLTTLHYSSCFAWLKDLRSVYTLSSSSGIPAWVLGYFVTCV